MRFGYCILNTYVPELDGPARSLYAHYLDQVDRAEALGFDSVWVTEHHFRSFGGMVPSPQLLLAAFAQRTRRVRLGTSVVLLPLHHPLRIAEEMGVLDVLSGGRIDFGVGQGTPGDEHERFGSDWNTAQARLREGVQLIRQAWLDPPPRRQGRPPKDSRVWPQDKLDRLRELWATDMSTKQIGVELGINKNSVISKAHRIGLSRPSPILSPAVEFTDAEIGIFLANPDKPVADIAHLFPDRTIQSLRAKRRTLQEQNILPSLPSSSDRSGVTESLPALPFLASTPAGDDPPRSDGALPPASAPPEADASALPWQMAVPSRRTRSAPTCSYIIGEGRTATQCDAPAVTLDEHGNRYASGAGMWCVKHRAMVYTKVRPVPRLEARV